MTTIRWILITTLGLVLNLAGTVQGQEPVRTWVSRDQQDSVEASFVDYDSRAKLVTLKTSTGSTIDVNWRDLSRADQRYVNKARKGISDPQVAKKNSKDRTSRRERRQPGAQRAFGILWTPGIENALAQAGKDRDSKQRPVMWFRVLGQLDGFM